jgi:hypothetical protein
MCIATWMMFSIGLITQKARTNSHSWINITHIRGSGLAVMITQ